MNSVFVSHWFDDQDRLLVSEIERVLHSHGIRPVPGDYTRGDALEQAIKERIDGTDGLIALATRREQKADGNWTTHRWVIDEYNHSKQTPEKPAIAIVEEGVDWGGMYAGHRHIVLDRANEARALLDLSNTIGTWKEAAGETWAIQLSPDDLAEHLDLDNQNTQCTYRTYNRGNTSEWRKATPVPEPGAVRLYPSGLRLDDKIQVKVQTASGIWISDVTAKWMPVHLKEM